MTTIAIILLAFALANIFLPGSAYKNKPVVDTHSVKFWTSLSFFVTAIALAVAVLI